jgi:hypothetical protein
VFEVHRPKCGSTDGMSDIEVGVGPAMNLKNRRLGSRSEILSANRGSRHIQSRRRGTGSSVGSNSRSFEKEKEVHSVYRLRTQSPRAEQLSGPESGTSLNRDLVHGRKLPSPKMLQGTRFSVRTDHRGFEPSTRQLDPSP